LLSGEPSRRPARSSGPARMQPAHACVSEIKKKFKRLDGNKDGSLSFGEMSRLLRKGRSDITDKEMEILFRRVDRNGNGRVEFGEFVDFVFEVSKSPLPTPSAKRGLVKRRQSWDHVADAQDIAWDQMKSTFFAYAGKNQALEGSEFARMCRDCNLLDEGFGSPEVDTIFAYVVAQGQRSMTPKQFLAALELIAEKKACPTVAVRAVIAHSKGPILTATKAQDVRFYQPG